MAQPDGVSPVPPSDALAVHHVGVKLPKFLDFDPELWLLQCDSAFATARITSEATRYHHAVAALDPEVIRKVRSYIKNPHVSSEYSSLKIALLNATRKPQPERVRALIDCTLGDSRPSDLLNSMKTAWPDDSTSSSQFLRELFLQKLPASLQPGLASASSLTLDELAERANIEVASFRLLNPMSSAPGVVSLVCAHPGCEPESPNHNVSESHPVLESYHSRHRGRFNRGNGRAAHHPNSNLCFYHQRFGAKARKCNPGCQFVPSGNASDARRQ